MLSKDRCKTTAGFFVIPLLSQLWEEKNYCERRNELSSWRPVALPNRHIHLYLFKLGYDVHALLSSVMYILSGQNITAVFTISRRRWDQNTTQVANRLDRARASYVRLLHVPPWRKVFTLLLCSLAVATVLFCIDPPVRIVTKSSKEGLLYFILHLSGRPYLKSFWSKVKSLVTALCNLGWAWTADTCGGGTSTPYR